MTPKKFAEKYYKNAAYVHLLLDIDDEFHEYVFDAQGNFAEMIQRNPFWDSKEGHKDMCDLESQNELRLYIL